MEFMKYCQRAMKLVKATPSYAGNEIFKSNDLFFIQHSATAARGILWNADIFEITGAKLEAAFSQVIATYYFDLQPLLL